MKLDVTRNHATKALWNVYQRDWRIFVTREIFYRPASS